MVSRRDAAVPQCRTALVGRSVGRTDGRFYLAAFGEDGEEIISNRGSASNEHHHHDGGEDASVAFIYIHFRHRWSKLTITSTAALPVMSADRRRNVT